MRPRFLITLGTALLIVVGLLILFKKKQESPTLPSVVDSQSQPPQKRETNSSPQPTGTTPNAQNAIPAHVTGVPDDVVEYVRNIKADPQYDWKRPINFWGRVVDENNEPVANASVHFEWNDISAKGTSDADTVSDGNGFFSLTDRRGKRLYVDVAKEGYYSSGNSRGSAFEYANPADGLFTPDQNNPIVFHLQKKGVGVDLITAQCGVKSDLRVSAPLDGKPVFVDVLNRQVGQTGQIQISQIKPVSNHWKEATEWQFRMTIPDGGFVEENDEFPFEAPEEGYQSTVEFDFQQGQPDWAIIDSCIIK